FEDECGKSIGSNKSIKGVIDQSVPPGLVRVVPDPTHDDGGQTLSTELSRGFLVQADVGQACEVDIPYRVSLAEVKVAASLHSAGGAAPACFLPGVIFSLYRGSAAQGAALLTATTTEGMPEATFSDLAGGYYTVVAALKHREHHGQR